MREYKIYKLTHPISCEIRYVGITTASLNQRLSQHKHAAFTKKVDTHVAKWFRSLQKLNILPKIELIEICNNQNWEEREKYWINQFNNLTNIQEGGRGVIVDRDIEGKQRSIVAHKKPVVLLNKDNSLFKEFESLTKCAEFLEINRTAVCNALKGNNFVSIYIILYKSDYVPNTFIKKYEGVHKDIHQFDLKGQLINTFSSINEAFVQINPCKYFSGLHKAVNKQGRCGNYLWSFNQSSMFESYYKNSKFSHKR